MTHDLVLKLLAEPTQLKVLGDGTQLKSYMHIEDCVNAIFCVVSRNQEKVDVFNIGSEDSIDVASVARIVCDEMGLSNVKLEFSGGIDGGRGWKGDIRRISLSIEKIRRLGFAPKYNSGESIRLAARALSKELKEES